MEHENPCAIDPVLFLATRSFFHASSPLCDRVPPHIRYLRGPSSSICESLKVLNIFPLETPAKESCFSVEIPKSKEIKTWQRLTMQRNCFLSTSGTLNTRTFISAYTQFQRGFCARGAGAGYASGCNSLICLTAVARATSTGLPS